MENELKIFENAEFGQVRVVMRANESWFVATDVCRALEVDPTATRRLDADEKITLRLTQGESARTSDTTVVSESGLYSLVLGSRKPEAKQFKRWITHEVIPSIRKTGGYIAGQDQMTDAELMAKAVLVAQNTIAEREKRIASMKITIESQQTRIVEMTPKAEYCDTILNTQGLIKVEDIAKLFGQSARWLNKWLHDMGIQFKRSSNSPWQLYEKYAKLGYAKTVAFPLNHGYYGSCRESLRWTQKGKKFICDLLIANGFKPIMPLDE